MEDYPGRSIFKIRDLFPRSFAIYHLRAWCDVKRVTRSGAVLDPDGEKLSIRCRKNKRPTRRFQDEPPVFTRSNERLVGGRIRAYHVAIRTTVEKRFRGLHIGPDRRQLDEVNAFGIRVPVEPRETES